MHLTSLVTSKYYLETDINEIFKYRIFFDAFEYKKYIKKISKLNNYLESFDLTFSIIGLSETWLNSYNSDLYELT